MRQWDWHKNRNRSLLGKKTKWDKNFHVQCAQTNNNTNKKKTDINAAPIRAVVPWQFCFSTVANTFIINVIVDAVIVRAMRCCIYIRIDPSYTCHNRFSIRSHPIWFLCQVFCGYYALMAQTLFQWYAADLAFFISFDRINAEHHKLYDLMRVTFPRWNTSWAI